jgi:5-formyltetrahydrofolate cyclo-ligase
MSAQPLDKHAKKFAMMTKARLRKIYLQKQKFLSDEERNEKSQKIAGGFFGNFDLENIRFLHLFLSIAINKEIKTSFIYKRLWKEFPEITTVTSRVNFQTMTLESLKFDSITKLLKNKWRIAEPGAGNFVQTEKIDVCLVPLLCFDERGFRVGYGKGFYDKFLSQCRTDCLKIGLSYFAPVTEISDAADFDIRLDFCITPEKVWEF